MHLQSHSGRFREQVPTDSVGQFRQADMFFLQDHFVVASLANEDPIQSLKS